MDVQTIVGAFGKKDYISYISLRSLHYQLIFAEGGISLAEVCHEVFGCSSGKMATDTGRYRSAVSKSKDPSGLLISVIR